MKDRHERKHRRTWRNVNSVATMAHADFGAAPPLADVMTQNFVAEVHGHRIYRDDDGSHAIWTPGTGWWAFGLDEKRAKATCEATPAHAAKGE